MTANGALISTNAAGVIANGSLISTNAAGVIANGSLISTNAVDVIENGALISTNTADVTANGALISSNAADVTSNDALISSNAADVAANGALISTNADVIDTNGSLISANADVLATNGTLIVDHGETITDISEVSTNNQIDILAMEASMADSIALGDYLSVDTDSHAIHFVGADVYIQNGSEETDVEGSEGGGNLISGYDAGDVAGKIGWHNLVIGDGHSYTESAIAFMQEANVDVFEAGTVEADTVDVSSSLTVYDHAYFYMAPAAFIVYNMPFYGW